MCVCVTVCVHVTVYVCVCVQTVCLCVLDEFEVECTLPQIHPTHTHGHETMVTRHM